MEVKWSQDGAKIESGSHLEGNGSGEAKKGAQAQIAQPIFEVIFEILEHLWQCIFGKFFGMAFFSNRRRFLSPRSPKVNRKGAKMEALATLETLSGKCKKHGRGYFFSTLGDLGESARGDFCQLALHSHSGRIPGNILVDFLRFW